MEYCDADGPDKAPQGLGPLYVKAPVMLHSVDAAGRLLAVNDRWLENLGYTRKEVIGRSLGDFLTEASKAEFARNLPIFLREGQVSEFPYTMLSKNGRTIDILLSSVGEYDGEGSFVRSLAAIEDITMRRETEQALAASEELFRMAFESANEGLCILSPEGNFLRVNEAFCEFMGYPAEVLTTMEVLELTHPDDRVSSTRLMARAVSGEAEHFRFEKRYFHASGRVIWGRVSARLVRDAAGAPRYIISHVLDVTESRRNSGQIALHTKTLEVLLRLGRMREAGLSQLGTYALSQAVALTGSADGLIALYEPMRETFRLLAAHPGALSAFGMPPGAQSFDPRRIKLFSAAWLSRQPVMANTPPSAPDAQSLPWRSLVVPVEGEGDNRLLIVVIDKDEPYDEADVHRLILLGEGVLGHVKDRARERDLERARKQAEAASQAKSGFLANMSHEIRTPLSGIIGLTQMTLSQSPRPEVREHLELILDSSRSLLAIVNDILDFSKIEAGKMEFSPVDFDLREILDRTMKPFHFSSRQKGLRLSSRISPGVPEVLHGDPDRIMQVVRNLVGNALKFTDQGEIAVEFRLLRPGDPMLVECAVRDTGIGIPEDRLPELFQVFSQLESSRTKRYGGTGLGLAISRRLVEMMGGTIGVRSRPGQGSIFSFTVSLRPAQEECSDSGGSRSEAPIGGFAGLTVLLAEDNQVNRLFLKHFLSEAGCEVRLAGSGGEALAQLQNGPVDLVLMDIQMPEMDGTEATRRIRDGEVGEANKGLPVVALTAYSMKGDRERFLSAGLDDYVSKPVDVDELFMVMRRVLDRRGRLPAQLIASDSPMDMAYYEERGKSTFAREICRMFLDESPRTEASLATAIRTGDWQRAGEAAHTLLGMSVPLRAGGLVDRVRRLQEACLSGDAAGCREAGRHILDELEKVRAAIRDMLQ
ncbi:PAS domain S-box protein [Solidesulfovibrio sp. C21]|uniref:PAS domain S-box protein n=1 Tax=Solidesulfovibrio sp. C21 TaxID=3398613 RepID=UPI0039FD5B71